MAMITLLTDFGLHDEYAGVMKGVALSINPQAQIVDLCHHVGPGDVLAGALMLAASAPFFPPGTVHVAVVDPGVGTARKILAASVGGSVFLAPDNGLLTLVLDSQKPLALVSVENSAFFLKNVSATFHGRDIFAPVAARLSLGLPLAMLGPALDPGQVARLDIPRPRAVEDGGLCGEVLAVDRFGNLMTNIPGQEAQKLLENGPEILVAGKAAAGLYRTYGQAPSQTLIALVGSRGFLEIAVAGGNAGQALGAGRGTQVLIRPQKA